MSKIISKMELLGFKSKETFRKKSYQSGINGQSNVCINIYVTFA